MMELRFWGVRGSIPVPGPFTAIVGGNTICVSVRVGNYFVVFDAGTGIREFGNHLTDKERFSWKGSVFLSHYHWDHIQGLPFFEPAFRSENRFHIYGEPKEGTSIHEILNEQMQSPYSPVSLDVLAGLVTFVELRAGQDIEIFPGAVLRTIRLEHPNGALGYRLDTPGGSVCFISDHEHPEGGLSESVVEFVQGTGVLIHDAQYTPEEKKRKRGWGHSSWEEAGLTARKAQVNQLYLIHHDPDRTDEELPIIEESARSLFENTDIATESTVYQF
jgi:phosphoribosyl 1,2-cyclic phosphodiesterase